jgi:hypothetical protein
MSSSISLAPPLSPESAGRRSLVAARLKPELRGAPSSGKLSRPSPPPRAALVLPFARLQLAFEVNFRALLAILLGDLAEVFVEDHDIDKFETTSTETKSDNVLGQTDPFRRVFFASRIGIFTYTIV